MPMPTDTKLDTKLKTEGVLRFTELLAAMRNFEANPNHVGTVAWNELSTALLRYEATGDHDHGWGNKPRPIAPGKPCPGGDCEVFKARRMLLRSLSRALGEYLD